jgi:hypothetical protein
MEVRASHGIAELETQAQLTVNRIAKAHEPVTNEIKNGLQSEESRVSDFALDDALWIRLS